MSITATAGENLAPTTRQGWNYGALWRAVPRHLGFLLLTMPIAITGLVVMSTLFWTGLGTIVLVFGIFVLVSALYVGRGFGTLELVRLDWSGSPAIRRPHWRTAQGEGFWRRWVFGPFADGHYWLYQLHGQIISPIVSTVTWSITVAWVATGLGGTTFWIWSRFLPDRNNEFWLHQVVLNWMAPGSTAGLEPHLGENLFELAAGVLFLLTLPYVTRGLVVAHHGIARGLLGAWPSESLQREVAALDASRGAAVAAEDQSLRRLERDIHDGPQQRLVRLQMDLAAAERRLESDPDTARSMLAEAREQARDTLEELRALSRGFAPPLLEDRGLARAVESLAGRSPIPVELEDGRLDADLRLPNEIERSAYFVLAELLTNAAKHSGASAIRVRMAIDEQDDASALQIWVVDNGRGGATSLPGHGLSGLAERLHGLRGTLSVQSPAGGPTTIGARIPIPGAAVS
ncbi:sensor domain-containing protein [Rathayibacter sp. YIM 133350]|uniref:sensor histidine kinase n=1 Tax=Rathayibacter sp. YIM 133350 TaxID=3131992 RepID=UPI00307EF5C7